MNNNSLDTTSKRPPLSLPFYYGWLVLSICFLTTLTSAGVRSSPSVLIHPLEAEFGWSRTLIASAVSMNLLLFGVAAPLSGYLIDRFGPRKLMMGSLLFLIVGVSGTMAMTEFWQFFLVWGVVVGLGAGGVGSVLTATIGNRWFVARRGLALGILGSASSTGQIIFLPFFMAMITYAAPGLFGHDQEAGESPTGLWAFWLQMAGMFGMTMAFAAAGIAQTYLERILGFGYLETQAKIQVHFLMVLGTGLLFVLGVGLYLYDFFFLAPKRRTAPAAWPSPAVEAES